MLSHPDVTPCGDASVVTLSDKFGRIKHNLLVDYKTRRSIVFIGCNCMTLILML